MRRLILAASLAAAMAVPALADPAGDVRNAFLKFADASSYHIAVSSSRGPAGEGDFVKPDRMHMMMGPAEMIALPDATYVKAGGNWMKLPRPMPNALGPTLDYVKGISTGKPADLKVEDLGMKTVDGSSFHAYKVEPKDAAVSTVYVNGDGYVARIDAVEKGNGATSVVKFSNYNAAIKIEAPI